MTPLLFNAFEFFHTLPGFDRRLRLAGLVLGSSGTEPEAVVAIGYNYFEHRQDDPNGEQLRAYFNALDFDNRATRKLGDFIVETIRQATLIRSNRFKNLRNNSTSAVFVAALQLLDDLIQSEPVYQDQAETYQDYLAQLKSYYFQKSHPKLFCTLVDVWRGKWSPHVGSQDPAVIAQQEISQAQDAAKVINQIVQEYCENIHTNLINQPRISGNAVVVQPKRVWVEHSLADIYQAEQFNYIVFAKNEAPIRQVESIGVFHLDLDKGQILLEMVFDDGTTARKTHAVSLCCQDLDAAAKLSETFN